MTNPITCNHPSLKPLFDALGIQPNKTRRIVITIPGPQAMPTFEPVAMRSIVLNRANKLAANSNFYIEGFEAHKMGNLVQAIFETIESQLQQAYEAGLRDAVPEGFTLVPTNPEGQCPMVKS